MSGKVVDLVMSETYNDFSRPQLLGLLHGVENVFRPYISARLSSFSKPNVVLADYGCSGGKNSMILIQRIFQMLKDSHNEEPAGSLLAILSDLPKNNYNAVFQAYQESEISKEKDRIYLSCSAGSFYNQLLPTESVDIAFSFTALHWLSRPTNLGSFHDPRCIVVTSADPTEDAEKIRELKEMAKIDLQCFLLARKQELVAGGLLMFSALGAEVLVPSKEQIAGKVTTAHNQFMNKKMEGSSWSHPFLCVSRNDHYEMGRLLQQARERFGIAVDESHATRILTFFPRSPEDVKMAITSHPDLKDGYEILYCEVDNAPDPYWSLYVSGEFDLETFVAVRSGYIRAWSETTVTSLLSGHSDAVNWFYCELKEKIRSTPQEFYLENNYLYCCLRKV